MNILRLESRNWVWLKCVSPMNSREVQYWRITKNCALLNIENHNNDDNKKQITF